MVHLKQKIQKMNKYITSIFSKLFKKKSKARIYTSLTIIVNNKTFMLEVDEYSLQQLKDAMDEDFTDTNISLRELILAYVSRSTSRT